MPIPFLHLRFALNNAGTYGVGRSTNGRPKGAAEPISSGRIEASQVNPTTVSALGDAGKSTLAPPVSTSMA